MEMKVWTPMFDLEKKVWAMFDRFPRLTGEVQFEFRPTTDVTRENGTLVVTTELPGIDPGKDVEISVEGDLLIIKGEKSAESEATEKDRYLHERHFGSFERRLPLPDGVKPESVSAAYDKGVLTVRVPIPEKTPETSRMIPVTVS